MNAKLMAACLCILVAPITAYPIPAQGRGPTPPKAARELVARATDLAGRDRIDEAIDVARRAIVAAPASLDAHVAYIGLRANFQGEIDAVRTEYEELMRREPYNPVFPLALFLADVGRPDEMRLLRLVATLSPDSSWGHYAQSFVIVGRTWEMMNDDFGGKGGEIAREALAAIDANAGKAFYLRAIHLQEAVHGVDAALLTAQAMASQEDLRPDGLRETWRLRLAKARGNQRARDDVKADMTALSRGATSIPLLAAVRDAYVTLVHDPAAADTVEQQILRIDPSWYPERGRATVTTVTNLTGLPYAIHAVNQQFAIYADVERLVLAREPDCRKEIASFEALLQRRPTPALERYILGFMFRSARRGGDVAAMTAFANRIARLDPSETAPFAMTALAMAASAIDLPTALDLAMKAERGVMEFRALPRPPGIPTADFASRFSAEQQQANHQAQRALALHSTGTVLLAQGRAAEAEERLRQSLALNRSSTTLAHLAETLDRLGRSDEAQALRREDNERAAADVQKRLTRRPATDFELEATDGRRYRLSELKGKVVLLNFWATWCGPCVGEMPLLSAMYEKYKARGVEVLAISTDEASDRGRVKQFAEGERLPFPVLYDTGVAKAFGINGYPTTVFIDRQGNIRYEESGAFESSGHRLEIILAELLR